MLSTHFVCLSSYNEQRMMFQTYKLRPSASSDLDQPREDLQVCCSVFLASYTQRPEFCTKCSISVRPLLTCWIMLPAAVENQHLRKNQNKVKWWIIAAWGVQTVTCQVWFNESKIDFISWLPFLPIPTLEIFSQCNVIQQIKSPGLTLVIMHESI